MNNLFKITDGPGKKTSEILKEMGSKFDVWVYDEKNVDKNFPEPKEETTRYFKKNVEPDTETLDKSADQIDPDGMKGCTLREYALMHLKYFEETGEYLDKEGWTVCSGSRLPGGRVALGRWYPGHSKVYFFWRYSGYSYPYMGARLAIPQNLDLVPSVVGERLVSSPNSVRNFTIEDYLKFIEKNIANIRNLLK